MPVFSSPETSPANASHFGSLQFRSLTLKLSELELHLSELGRKLATRQGEQGHFGVSFLSSTTALHCWLLSA